MLAQRLLPDGEAEEPPKERVDVIDNAKGALIILVVLYHTLVVYSSADRPEVRVARARERPREALDSPPAARPQHARLSRPEPRRSRPSRTGLACSPRASRW